MQCYVSAETEGKFLCTYMCCRQWEYSALQPYPEPYPHQCCPGGEVGEESYPHQCCPGGEVGEESYPHQCCPGGEVGEESYPHQCCPGGEVGEESYTSSLRWYSKVLTTSMYMYAQCSYACLFDLACFFLLSFSSLIKTCVLVSIILIYMCQHVYLIVLLVVVCSASPAVQTASVIWWSLS